MQLAIAAGVTLSLISTATLAQDAFPTKPITIVVGFAPGGGMDTMARLVGARMATELGQQIVVENRSGAGGTIAPAHVAAARPDGYTLYAGETAAVVGPVFHENVGYDLIDSFIPVARVAVAPHALVASTSAEAQTLEEFIELVGAHPGEHFYATPGTTTLQYLAGEMLKDQLGLEIDAVHFQGGSPSVAAVVSNEVPFGIVSLSAAASQAEGGNLTVLAHTGPERVEGFEDVPPIAETVDGFSAVPAQFIMAPAGTPQEIVDRLTQAAEIALQDEKLLDQLRTAGLVPAYQSGSDFAAELPEIATLWTGIATTIRDDDKP